MTHSYQTTRLGVYRTLMNRMEGQSGTGKGRVPLWKKATAGISAGGTSVPFVSTRLGSSVLNRKLSIDYHVLQGPLVHLLEPQPSCPLFVCKLMRRSRRVNVVATKMFFMLCSLLFVKKE